MLDTAYSLGVRGSKPTYFTQVLKKPSHTQILFPQKTEQNCTFDWSTEEIINLMENGLLGSLDLAYGKLASLLCRIPAQHTCSQPTAQLGRETRIGDQRWALQPGLTELPAQQPQDPALIPSFIKRRR